MANQWQRWKGIMKCYENSFWEKVDKKDKDDCWEWKSWVAPNGYGQFNLDGTTVYAHRLSWMLLYGEIPYKANILHACDNRKCCNPNHLYKGTQSDNMNDREQRNPGSNSHTASLKEGEIWLIRKLHIHTTCSRHKFSKLFVSKMFKVSSTTIYRIWESDKYLCKEGYYV